MLAGDFVEDLLVHFQPLNDALSRLDNKDKTTNQPATREDVVAVLKTIGILSSGNTDSDSDAETCERTRERMPSWWEFTSIKQHRRDRCLASSKLREIIDFCTVPCFKSGCLHSKKFAINSVLISNDECVKR